MIPTMPRGLPSLFLVVLLFAARAAARHENPQPLARLLMENSKVRKDARVSISATPDLLGAKGEAAEYVTVKFNKASGANITDWIGVFSPANFDANLCPPIPGTVNYDLNPYLCSAPVKYAYANMSTPNYGTTTGEGSISFRLINIRADYAFGFFEGDVSNPVLLAVSNAVKFSNPKAPGFLRLSNGKEWNEMTVSWTSGYSLEEATPFVKWGMSPADLEHTTMAGTSTYSRSDMCGAPASTVGWRDPGFLHSAVLKELWPNAKYCYQVGHLQSDGTYDWGRQSFFKAAPYPGQNSLQRVIIYGDMGKAERDGSNEYNDYQPGSLNTTDTLAADLDNFDIILHNGDLTYANGYTAQWDQFTEQIEVLSSRVPYMTSSGNHERDWPFTGSYFNNTDSGGECGVLAQLYFNMPAKNRAQYWYSTQWGMFHFCIAHSELDWREGTEQYKFLEECFASVDRQKQPWLIFLAHRVLGYSSGSSYATEGTFAEPGGREDLEKLWQKYKVDIAFYGHVHNYERTCPIYESICTSKETQHFSGRFNGTIHIVAGGAGAHLSSFTTLNTSWSLFKDFEFGFTKLTAFDKSNLLVEYKRSMDGLVYDSFTITRNYADVLGCDSIDEFCPPFTLAH